MAVKISQIGANVTVANLVAADGYVPVVANVAGNLTTFRVPLSNIRSYITSVNTAATFASDVIFSGNITVAGDFNVSGDFNSVSQSAITSSANMIEVQTDGANPNGSLILPGAGALNLNAGIRLFYNRDNAINAAAMIYNTTQGRFQFYGAGVGNLAPNVSFTAGATLGNVEVGSFVVANTTPSTGMNTGAMQVRGGACIAGNLHVGGMLDIDGVVISESRATATDLIISNVANITRVETTSLRTNEMVVVDTTTLTGNTQTSNIIPINSNVSSLGSETQRYNNVYAANIIADSVTYSSANVSNSNSAVLTVNTILPLAANISNIGTSASWFNTVYASRLTGVSMTARYADLAEKYLSDADYTVGTVTVFGGDAEITTTNFYADVRVAGVVSENPAYLMNTDSSGLPIALRGKVPVRVIGSVKKGDLLVTAPQTGCAQAVSSLSTYNPVAVFAKAIEESSEPGEKLIMAVVI